MKSIIFFLRLLLPERPSHNQVVFKWKNDGPSYDATGTPVKAGEGRSPLDFAEIV